MIPHVSDRYMNLVVRIVLALGAGLAIAALL